MPNIEESAVDLNPQRANTLPLVTPSKYYQEMRELALQKRNEYKITTSELNLSKIRQIYKQEGIKIDQCPGKLRKLKAAYFNDKNGCHVLLNMNIPYEPRLFAMVHELKHHYVDKDGLSYVCSDIYDHSPMIEIGAEVFSAEFLFPLNEFQQYIEFLGISKNITQEDIVQIKYSSPVKVSYQFILKRLIWLKLIGKDEFKNVQFQKLHQVLYGASYFHSRRKVPSIYH